MSKYRKDIVDIHGTALDQLDICLYQEQARQAVKSDFVQQLTGKEVENFPIFQSQSIFDHE